MSFYSQAVILEKSLSRCFQAELTDHFYFLRVERHQGKKKTETFLMVERIQTGRYDYLSRIARQFLKYQTGLVVLEITWTGLLMQLYHR